MHAGVRGVCVLMCNAAVPRGCGAQCEVVPCITSYRDSCRRKSNAVEPFGCCEPSSQAHVPGIAAEQRPAHAARCLPAESATCYLLPAASRPRSECHRLVRRLGCCGHDCLCARRWAGYVTGRVQVPQQVLSRRVGSGATRQRVPTNRYLQTWLRVRVCNTSIKYSRYKQ